MNKLKEFINKKFDLLNDQQKAMLITFFISSSLVMMVFNSNLKQQDKIVSETYYEVNPEEFLTEEEVKAFEALEKQNIDRAETNNAYNETAKSNRFDKAYAKINPAKDFEREDDDFNEEPIENTEQNYDPIEKEEIDQEDISTFDKVNELLQKQDKESNNNKSNVSFSLKNREKRFIPIPVYLCEDYGKVVVSVKVDSKGYVTEASFNSLSTTSNKCLVDNAIIYAKRAKFSSSSTNTLQSGTITYNFIGKH